MKNLTIEYKHKKQVSGINKITDYITGHALEYWNRYQDECAKQFLALKTLELNHGRAYAQQLEIVSINIH